MRTLLPFLLIILTAFASPALALDCVERTGSSATLIVYDHGLLAEDRVSVLEQTSGLCVGESVVPASRGNIAIAVWEDNPFTVEVDGARQHQFLDLVVERGGTRIVGPLAIGIYQPDGVDLATGIDAGMLRDTIDVLEAELRQLATEAAAEISSLQAENATVTAERDQWRNSYEALESNFEQAVLDSTAAIRADLDLALSTIDTLEAEAAQNSSRVARIFQDVIAELRAALSQPGQ